MAINAGINPFTPHGGGHYDGWGKFTFIGARNRSITLPGVVTSVDGHDRVSVWAMQKGLGASFGVAVWRGHLSCESIKVTSILTLPEHFVAYDELRKLTPLPSDVQYQSFGVVNPALNWAGITRCGFRTLGTPRALPSLGWSVTLDLIEVRVPRSVKVGPPDKDKPETANGLKAIEVGKLFNIAKGPFPSGT